MSGLERLVWNFIRLRKIDRVLPVIEKVPISEKLMQLAIESGSKKLISVICRDNYLTMPMFQLLLRSEFRHIEVNIRSEELLKGMELFIELNMINVIEGLLSFFEFSYSRQGDCLYTAIQFKRFKILKLLLDKGFRFDQKPLIIASFEPEAIRLLSESRFFNVTHRNQLFEHASGEGLKYLLKHYHPPEWLLEKNIDGNRLENLPILLQDARISLTFDLLKIASPTATILLLRDPRMFNLFPNHPEYSKIQIPEYLRNPEFGTLQYRCLQIVLNSSIPFPIYFWYRKSLKINIFSWLIESVLKSSTNPQILHNPWNESPKNKPFFENPRPKSKPRGRIHQP